MSFISFSDNNVHLYYLTLINDQEDDEEDYNIVHIGNFKIWLTDDQLYLLTYAPSKFVFFPFFFIFSSPNFMIYLEIKSLRAYAGLYTFIGQGLALPAVYLLMASKGFLADPI